MKLQNTVETERTGTYVAVRFSTETKDKLIQYIRQNDIPNAVAKNDLHTTVLFSRKHLPYFTPDGKLDNPLIGYPTELDIWETTGTVFDSVRRCLVLKYSSSALVKRHEFILERHEATHDFPEYVPHITLSYDVEDLEIDQLTDPKTIIDAIVIVEEYGWADKKLK